MYRRHRGVRWAAGRFAGAIIGSIILGSIFGVLSGLGLTYGNVSAFRDDGLFFLVGGVIGAATFPALLLVVTSRNAFVGVLVVSVATAAAAIASGVLTRTFDALPITFVVTVGVYVIGCIWWRARSGSDAWIDVHGLCWKCGYDLKGLTPLVCPECGAAVDTAAE